MEIQNIGIVGFGFVGSALAHGFSTYYNIKIYDKYCNQYDSLEDVVRYSTVIFICVPTPTNKDGLQDLSYIRDALSSISSISEEENDWDDSTKKILVIKSTILPGTTRKLSSEFPKHTIVFNPEFLTERTAKLDFINSSRIVLGGMHYPTSIVEIMYRKRFPHTPIFKTSWEGAELVKYMCNSFFAMKISFMNEMYDISQKLNVPFDELKDMFLTDYRIGNSHCDVPGHDGKRGFSGLCLPKDSNAFWHWAEQNGMILDSIKTACKINDRIRPEKDWENIKGASDKNKYE